MGKMMVNGGMGSCYRLTLGEHNRHDLPSQPPREQPARTIQLTELPRRVVQ